jgi:hypothetical protein
MIKSADKEVPNKGGGGGVSSIFKPSVAKFLVPDWGDIVDSGIELSWPSRLHRQGAGTTTLCQSRPYPQLGD